MMNEVPDNGADSRGPARLRALSRYWPMLLLVVGLVSPLVLSTWYTFNREREALERATDLELKQMTSVLANGMSEPIWNLTPELGQPLVTSVLEDPRVLSVIVDATEDDDFFLRADRADPQSVSRRRYSQQVIRRGQIIGEVHVDVDTGAIAAQMGGHWPEIYAVGAIQALLALGVVVFVYSALRRQERNKALREMNRLLQAEVDARAEELERAHDELLRKESLAVLGRLTATVSHELRNPLGTIGASLSTLSKVLRDSHEPSARTSATVTRVLERAQRNIDRCSRITDELLGFTRLAVMHRESTSFDDWLRDLLAEYPVPENIELVVDLHSDAVVDVDREQLRRAVTNVLGNAVQAVTGSHGPAHGARLEVRTRRTGDRMELVVRDNGDGIAPELRERIFEPLFSTRAFGFGLGLPLVKHVSEHHGGGVDVGDLDDGAEIVLWLPIDGHPDSEAREHRRAS